MPVNEKNFHRYRMPRAVSMEMCRLATINQRRLSAETLIAIENHLSANRALLRKGGKLPGASK